MTKSKILEITTKSKAEQWPYPKIFDALKAAGVEAYEVQVEQHLVTYFADGTCFQEDLQKGENTLTVSSTYNKSAVRTALERTQAKKSTYSEFLREIAQAGVWKYRVDMSKRSVSYLGKHGEEYTEAVPALKTEAKKN